MDFALQQQLESATGDLDVPERSLQAIKGGIAFLTSSPVASRKAGRSSFIHELILPFGHAGDVALFQIVGSNTFIIGAIRHQLEDDYF